MADTLYENHDSGSGNQFQSAMLDIAIGQSFVAESDHTINKVSLYLKRYFGIGDGIVWTVALYAADASHHPTGAALATYGTFVVDDMSSSSYGWYPFYSDTYDVTEGVEYVITLTPDTYIGDAAIYWFTTSSNNYTTGRQSQSSGGAWTDRNSGVNDGYFRMYSTLVAPTKPTNPTPGDTDTSIDRQTAEITWEDGGGADTFDVYFGTESGNLDLLKSGVDVGSPSWVSPLVILEIKDYNPAVGSGYRSPEVGDTLSNGNTDYYINDIKVGDLVNVQYEAKLFAYRIAGESKVAGDVLTNGVSPDPADPQAVSVTLNDSIYFNGDVERPYWPWATTYYWRIDATNDVDTTTGDEWSFTILEFDPPLPSGMSFSGDPDDAPTGTPTGESNMVTVRRLVAIAKNRLWYEDV